MYNQRSLVQFPVVVSGRASDLKCSCATLVYKFVDPALIHGIKKKQATSKFSPAYHRVSGL